MLPKKNQFKRALSNSQQRPCMPESKIQEPTQQQQTSFSISLAPVPNYSRTQQHSQRHQHPSTDQNSGTVIIKSDNGSQHDQYQNYLLDKQSSKPYQDNLYNQPIESSRYTGPYKGQQQQSIFIEDQQCNVQTSRRQQDQMNSQRNQASTQRSQLRDQSVKVQSYIQQLLDRKQELVHQKEQVSVKTKRALQEYQECQSNYDSTVNEINRLHQQKQSVLNKSEIRREESPRKYSLYEKKKQVTQEIEKCDMYREQSLKLQDEVREYQECLNYKKEHLYLLKKQLNERSAGSYISDAEGFFAEEEKACMNEIDRVRALLSQKENQFDDVINQISAQQKTIKDLQFQIVQEISENGNQRLSLGNTQALLNSSLVEREQHIDAIGEGLEQLERQMENQMKDLSYYQKKYEKYLGDESGLQSQIDVLNEQIMKCTDEKTHIDLILTDNKAQSFQQLNQKSYTTRTVRFEREIYEQLILLSKKQGIAIPESNLQTSSMEDSARGQTEQPYKKQIKEILRSLLYKTNNTKCPITPRPANDLYDFQASSMPTRGILSSRTPEPAGSVASHYGCGVSANSSPNKIQVEIIQQNAHLEKEITNLKEKQIMVDENYKLYESNLKKKDLKIQKLKKHCKQLENEQQLVTVTKEDEVTLLPAITNIVYIIKKKQKSMLNGGNIQNIFETTNLMLKEEAKSQAPQKQLRFIKDYVRKSLHELAKVEQLKKTKNKCLEMFEKESEELQKGWLLLEEEKQKMHQREDELLQKIADREKDQMAKRQELQNELIMKGFESQQKQDELKELNEKMTTQKAEQKKEQERQFKIRQNFDEEVQRLKEQIMKSKELQLQLSVTKQTLIGEIDQYKVEKGQEQQQRVQNDKDRTQCLIDIKNHRDELLEGEKVMQQMRKQIRETSMELDLLKEKHKIIKEKHQYMQDEQSQEQEDIQAKITQKKEALIKLKQEIDQQETIYSQMCEDIEKTEEKWNSIQKALQKIPEREQYLSQLSHEINNKEQLHEELDNKIEIGEESLQNGEQLLNQLSEQINNKQEELNQILHKINVNETQMQQMIENSQQLKEKQQLYEELVENEKQTRSDLGIVHQQLESATDQLQQKEKELDDCSAEFSLIIDEFNKTKNQLVKEKEYFGMQVQQEKKKLEQLNAKIVDQNKEYKENEAELSKLKEEIDNFKLEKEQLLLVQQKIQSLKVKYQQHQNEEHKLKDSVQQLKTQKSKLENEVLSLEKLWTETSIKFVLNTLPDSSNQQISNQSQYHNALHSGIQIDQKIQKRIKEVTDSAYQVEEWKQKVNILEQEKQQLQTSLEEYSRILQDQSTSQIYMQMMNSNNPYMPDEVDESKIGNYLQNNLTQSMDISMPKQQQVPPQKRCSSQISFNNSKANFTPQKSTGQGIPLPTNNSIKQQAAMFMNESMISSQSEVNNQLIQKLIQQVQETQKDLCSLKHENRKMKSDLEKERVQRIQKQTLDASSSQREQSSFMQSQSQTNNLSSSSQASYPFKDVNNSQKQNKSKTITKSHNKPLKEIQKSQNNISLISGGQNTYDQIDPHDDSSLSCLQMPLNLDKYQKKIKNQTSTNINQSSHHNNQHQIKASNLSFKERVSNILMEADSDLMMDESNNNNGQKTMSDHLEHMMIKSGCGQIDDMMLMMDYSMEATGQEQQQQRHDRVNPHTCSMYKNYQQVSSRERRQLQRLQQQENEKRSRYTGYNGSQVPNNLDDTYIENQENHESLLLNGVEHYLNIEEDSIETHTQDCKQHIRA